MNHRDERRQVLRAILHRTDDLAKALETSDELLTNDAAIERVARALCAFDYENPDEAEFEYAKHGEDEYLPAARAAVAALLEEPA